jgi:hypothetical protein
VGISLSDSMDLPHLPAWQKIRIRRLEGPRGLAFHRGVEAPVGLALLPGHWPLAVATGAASPQIQLGKDELASLYKIIYSHIFYFILRRGIQKIKFID